MFYRTKIEKSREIFSRFFVLKMDANGRFILTKELAKKRCVPCSGGVQPLKGLELKAVHEKLDGDWRVADEHHLEKEFTFKDFRQALDFTNEVGELAETVGHHPDICLSWGKVRITIWTHKIDGLTESDFILAAKVNEIR
jgi:4a-hydroxytetrahydrobiopterin dehydratase